MTDTIADRVRTIVAVAAKLPPSDVRLDSTFDELQIDFIERIEIGFELERAFELPFDTIDEATDATWKTVADVVATAEKLARQYAAPADRGRAA